MVIVQHSDGRSFQIYDWEWTLAQRMDGTRTLEMLIAEARKLGVPADQEGMVKVVSQLQQYGFLAPTASSNSAPPHPRSTLPPVGPASIPPPSAPPMLQRVPSQAPSSAPPRPVSAPPQSRPSAAPSIAPPAPRLVQAVFEDDGVPDRTAVEQAPVIDEMPDRTAVGNVPPMNPDDEMPDRTAIGNITGLPFTEASSLSRPPLQSRPPAQEPEEQHEQAGGDEAASDEDGAEEAPRPLDPWSDAALRQSAASKRRKITWGIVGGVVLLSAVVRYPLRIVEPVEFRPATRSEVRATGDGVITRIVKKEGEAVAAGEAIAELDSTDVRAHLDELAAREAELKAELDKLRKGSRPEEIARAAQAISARRVAFNFSKQKANRQQQLFSAKLASQDDRDAARFDMEIKKKELYNAEADYNLVKAGARSEDVEAKQAEIERVEAEEKFAQTELTKKQVRSPIAGLLVTPHYDESLGRAVHQGDLVAEVAQLDRMRAEILLPQAELGEVHEKQPVTLKVESYPGISFHGEVQFIPRTASDTDDHSDKIIRVTAYVDNSDLLLRDKMSGWGEIDTGSRPILGIVLRRFIRWFRVRYLI